MKYLFILFALSIIFSCNSHNVSKEETIIEFKTTNGKKLRVSIGENQRYLVYRYGSQDTVELEYPSDLENSWSKFQFSWYLRGGGKMNEGMDLNYLYFDVENYRYVVYQEYRAVENILESGIKVINLQTDKVYKIKADPKSVDGGLFKLRDIEQIEIGDELF